MQTEGLSESDHDLIGHAKSIVIERRTPGWNEVGAALLTRSGNIYRAIHLDADTGRIAVCGEAIALGMAIAEGDVNLDTIVAVTTVGPDTLEVLPPCGMCRELLNDYDPTIKVILPSARGELQKTEVTNLLPGRWHRSKRFPDPL